MLCKLLLPVLGSVGVVELGYNSGSGQDSKPRSGFYGWPLLVWNCRVQPREVNHVHAARI
eukprot:4377803-Amphidinium_carterae.2